MSLFITEHAGIARLKSGVTPSPLSGYAMTSAAAVTPAAAAEFIRVTADAGSWLGIVASTTAALSSTNAYRIPPNAPPELFGIRTGYKLMAAST